MTKHGDFCWNELMTDDVETAKAFYKAMFNWEYQQLPGSDRNYTMIKTPGGEAGGIMQTPADKQIPIPAHWMSYINVDNLDEAIKKAISLGARVKIPATAAGDFGHFAFLVDPTGAHIALWQSNQTCK